MNKSRLLLTFFIVILLSLAPSVVLAQTGTDVIRDYRIEVLPQDDASLINAYTINWCVISDAAGPLTDINVGMPNSDYQIMDFSGDARSVNSADQGANTRVNVVLTKSVNANECVTVTFRIHQMGLAHLDEAKGEIGFQFIPGWFGEVPVDHLQVSWHLPADNAQLKSLSPEPKMRDTALAVWETVLQPGGKLTLNLLYDKAAFPNYGQESTPVWPLQGGGGSAGSSTSPTTKGGAAAATESTVSTAEPLLGIIPVGLTTCVCALIIFILVILILVSILARGVRSYRGGGTIGGSRPGGGIFGGGGPIFLPPSRPGGGGIFGGGGGGSISLTPSRSGGGGGLFGGRGSSCACVACACACACAGGGRAGCSRKGFDISGLLKKSALGKNNEK